MNLCKGILASALVLAIAAPSFALPLNQPHQGFININLINADEGTIYVVNDGDANTEAEVDALANQVPGLGSLANEDGWGIFNVQSITTLSGSTTLYSDSDAPDPENVELMGIFYGVKDQTVSWSTNSSNLPVLDITSNNVTIDLWQLPAGTPYPVANGPGGRTGASTYTGMTDVPGAKLLARVISRAPGGGTPEYNSQLRFDANNVITDGEFNGFMDIVPNVGSEWQLFDTNTQLGGTDWWVQGDLIPTPIPGEDTFGWSFLSSDPVRANIIPEPITMGAFGLAFAGIGSYIRRRRR